MDVIESAGGGYGPGGGGGYGPPPGGYAPPGTPPGAPPMGPAPYVPPYPPPAYPQVAGAPFGIEPLSGLPYSDKQKIVAGILQLFFPGVGRIYVGNTGLGIAQLVTAFFCVGAIWAFVDGIMMLAGKVRDAEGRPLRD